MLGKAYQSRSKYVHQLRQLPDALTLGHGHGETVVEDRATHLTLQGLSRLMRSVIIEFVVRQPTVLHEPYNYRLERSGVVQVRLAPQYWVGYAGGDITRAGRDKLEGFLEQLASRLLREPDAIVTDLRPVLAVACEVVPRLEKRLRLPYLALHALFNMHVAKQDLAPMPSAIEALIQKELGEPSSESLIAHALAGQTVQWSVEAHRVALNTYLRRRAAANGLRFPRLFEAAIALELAERLRCAGDMDGCRRVVALAVENHPGHTGLLAVETNLLSAVPICWRDVMLSAADQSANSS